MYLHKVVFCNYSYCTIGENSEVTNGAPRGSFFAYNSRKEAVTIADLTITNLVGESELLVGYAKDSLAIKSAVNGDRSLSFLLPKSGVNEHAFDLVEEESVIEYDGHSYRIKNVTERVVRSTPVKAVTAPHVFFDIVDDFRYDTLTTGFKSIAQVLSFIFNGTDWSFSVIDSFDTVEFENFGNANCLDLFSKVLERYGAEFDLSGNNVIIRNKIGSLIDLQFRYNHNVKTLNRTVDTSNLSTYIKGTGKQREDGSYYVEAEYTSPNASIFGIKHAPPYSNESITHLATLERNLQRAIQDTPEVSIELEFVVLKDAGYTKPKPSLGDVVPTIYEPLKDLDLDLRVMEIEEYPESNKAPKVVLATSKLTLADADFSYQKALLDKIYDANSGRLRYNVYDEAVKRATEALNNSLTELEYPVGMGIIARDPNDPNRFVALRSSGLGITTNGGLTFDEAITVLGVNTSLLTAGQIKTNNIQIIGNDDLFYWDGNYLIAINAADPNKFVRLNSDGLYVAKGALTVERPDGFKTIIDGYSNFNVNVESADPPFRSNNLTQVGRFCATTSTVKEDFNLYSFRHEARYLKLDLAHYVDTNDFGAYGEIIVDLLDAGNTNLFTASFINGIGGEQASLGRVYTVDLGVPTGNAMSIYLRLRSSSDLKNVYLRKRRIWLEG